MSASHLWDSVRNEAQAAVESSHKYAKHLHEMLQTRVLPHRLSADAISTNLAKNSAKACGGKFQIDLLGGARGGS